jgi:hypothetical protein
MAGIKPRSLGQNSLDHHLHTSWQNSLFIYYSIMKRLHYLHMRKMLYMLHFDHIQTESSKWGNVLSLLLEIEIIKRPQVSCWQQTAVGSHFLCTFHKARGGLMWTRIKLSIIYACQWTKESDLSVSDLKGSNNDISHFGFLLNTTYWELYLPIQGKEFCMTESTIVILIGRCLLLLPKDRIG